MSSAEGFLLFPQLGAENPASTASKSATETKCALHLLVALNLRPILKLVSKLYEFVLFSR